MSFCVPVSSDPVACALFSYRGDVVAIDLVGAGIPLTLSLVLVLVLFLRGGRRINVHRIAIYFIMTIILGAAVAVEYLVWDQFYGGLSAPTQLVLFTVIIPVGIALFLLLDRKVLPKLSLLQIYVVGTVGMALSDLFRTFSGLVNVSPQIMGADRLQDAVFLDGLLLVLGYVFGAALYSGIMRYMRDRKGGSTLPPKGDAGWPAAGAVIGQMGGHNEESIHGAGVLIGTLSLVKPLRSPKAHLIALMFSSLFWVL